MVESGGLENRWGFTPSAGSNPVLSAIKLRSHFSKNFLGGMSELAEGARLEIVCAAKSGTGGSNPSLSAIKYPGVLEYWNVGILGLTEGDLFLFR